MERHKNAIEKQEQVKKIKEDKEVSLQSPASTTSTPTKPDAQKEAFKQNFLEQMKKASPSLSATSSPSTPQDSPAKKSDKVEKDHMRNFFNNLLKKDKN